MFPQAVTIASGTIWPQCAMRCDDCGLYVVVLYIVIISTLKLWLHKCSVLTVCPSVSNNNNSDSNVEALQKTNFKELYAW